MRRFLAITISLGVTALLIAWLFRDTDWPALGEALSQVHVGWLLAAKGLVWLSFFLRVQRWSYIVRATEPASFRAMFSATQIGFLANFALAYRAGEIIRAFILSRLTPIPFVKGMALVTLDRVTDVIGLVVVLLMAVAAFHYMGAVYIPAELLVGQEPFLVPPGMVQIATAVTVGLTVGLIAMLSLLYVNQDLAVRISDRCLGFVSQGLARRVHRMLMQFAQGLHIFRSPSDMAKSVCFSLLTWGCFVLSVYFFLWAFHIEAPWYTPFVVQALLAVAIVVPIAPGFVGQFHFGIVAGLLLAAPHVSMATAQAVAITAHLMNLIPVFLAGLFCLWLEHLGLFDLRRESMEAEAALHPGDQQ